MRTLLSHFSTLKVPKGGSNIHWFSNGKWVLAINTVENLQIWGTFWSKVSKQLGSPLYYFRVNYILRIYTSKLYFMDDRCKTSYPEIVPLSALIACNAINSPGGAAIYFSHKFHHWLMLYTFGQYKVGIRGQNTLIWSSKKTGFTKLSAGCSIKSDGKLENDGTYFSCQNPTIPLLIYKYK